MGTITEDYVSFETAKLLKEKGFDEYCPESYFKMDKTLKKSGFSEWEKVNEIKAPTLQMAMKWLRKKHKLCIVSIPVVTDDDGDGGCLWKFVISRKLKPLYESEHLYESPETAFNDAIKYCFENLI